MPTVKERFESHPVVWGLGLLLVGFLAGIGTEKYMRPVTPTPDVPTTTLPKKVACTIEGFKELEESYRARMDTLQRQVASMEKNATYGGNIESTQKKYENSANRIRADIKEENKVFSVVIESLRLKCS